jgi:hypothetical protein
MNTEIEKLKTKFRQWYGTLSVTELGSNSALIQAIQDLETMLREITYDQQSE